MKPLKMIGFIALMASMVLSLGACSKKKNSASTPASTCVRNAFGQLVDQFGRNCSQYGQNSCYGATYNPSTGQYIGPNGIPVNCAGSGLDGYNAIPYYGNYNGSYINGCQGWAQVYGVQYVPVDVGNGQLVCLNTNYLYQQAPSYNWNQYAYQQVPVYVCTPGIDCGGGNFGGYNYQCQGSINLGFLTGLQTNTAFGGGLNMCLW